MHPIKFKEANVTYAKDQPEYLQLPAFKANCEEGYATSCWKLSWRERLKMLFTGRIFITVMTFNRPLQPLFATTKFEDYSYEQNQSCTVEEVTK